MNPLRLTRITSTRSWPDLSHQVTSALRRVDTQDQMELAKCRIPLFQGKFTMRDLGYN